MRYVFGDCEFDAARCELRLVLDPTVMLYTIP